MDISNMDVLPLEMTEENKKDIFRGNTAVPDAPVNHHNIYPKGDKRQDRTKVNKTHFPFCGKKLSYKAT